MRSKDIKKNKVPVGWQCPVCGNVYSPYITKCESSHQTAKGGTTKIVDITVGDTPLGEWEIRAPICNMRFDSHPADTDDSLTTED